MARKSLSLDALVPDAKPPESRPETPVEAPAPKKPTYREGKRAFTAWANKAAYKQLKNLANDRETTVQALLEEGMDLVFERYGYSQIARAQSGNEVTKL